MYIYADLNGSDLYCADMLLPEEDLYREEYGDTDTYIGEAYAKEDAQCLLEEYTEELGEDTIRNFLTIFDLYDWKG